jgi:hypothetical protein
MWEKIERKCAVVVNRHKHRPTTIFGRSTIINTLLIPKVIYISTVFDPPKETKIKINKMIRSFVFGNTKYSIKDLTLSQPKTKGGINLQNIEVKIQALRIAYISQIEKNVNQHPIAVFYIGKKLHQIMQLDNLQTHRRESPSPFYKSCLQAVIGNELLINKKTKDVYQKLIEIKEPRLQDRIQKGKEYQIVNFDKTFQNLHKSKITQKEKE